MIVLRCEVYSKSAHLAIHVYPNTNKIAVSPAVYGVNLGLTGSTNFLLAKTKVVPIQMPIPLLELTEADMLAKLVNYANSTFQNFSMEQFHECANNTTVLR